MTIASDAISKTIPVDQVFIRNTDIVLEPVGGDVIVTGNQQVSGNSQVAGALTVVGAVSAGAVTSTGSALTTPTITSPVVTDSVEVVITTNTLAASESGKVCFLSLAGGFVTTLPAPAAGLKFKFYVKAAPSGGSYTIVTNAAAQVLGGAVHSSDGVDGDSEAALTGTTITFVDGQSHIGDSAEVISDGDGWYANILVDISTGATITG